jgi:Txe/YoeB family toxin of Txe-Axe toxin-antitoxin module
MEDELNKQINNLLADRKRDPSLTSYVNTQDQARKNRLLQLEQETKNVEQELENYERHRYTPETHTSPKREQSYQDQRTPSSYKIKLTELDNKFIELMGEELNKQVNNLLADRKRDPSLTSYVNTQIRAIKNRLLQIKQETEDLEQDRLNIFQERDNTNQHRYDSPQINLILIS